MEVKADFNEMSVYEGPGQSPGFLLWQVSTFWRSSIELVLKSFGLTHPQFVVLAVTGWLTRNGEKITQAAIGKMSGIDPNTLSQVLKGLETKHLIKREKSSDGRAKSPQLTTQGKKILENALPAVEQADSHFFDVLTKAELQNLLKIFQKIIGNGAI